MNIERKYIIAFVLLAIAGAIVRLVFTQFTVDDAYITLRYAENLAAGNGFVFNEGERVYGTTTPLLTLVLALSAMLTNSPLLAGKIINIFADIGVAALLFSFAHRFTGRGFPALLAGLVYLSNPVAIKWSALGMETALYTFFICGSLWMYACSRHKTAYLFAGLATLTRIDGSLLFALLFCVDIWRRRWRALPDATIGILPVLAWAIFAFGYFGSPIPHSATAKKLTYGGSSPFVIFKFILNKFMMRNIVSPAIAAVGLIGAYRLLFKSKTGVVILAWFAVYLGFFIVNGVHFHGWYFGPTMWVYSLAVALGLTTLIDYLIANIDGLRHSNQAQRLIQATVLSGLVIAAVWLVANRHQEVNDSIFAFETEVTRATGDWLYENSSPTDTVALESIGAVGYYSQLYVLDEVGLVSPQVVPLNRESAAGPNFGGIIQTFRPRWYVCWDTWELNWWKERPDQLRWLEGNYEHRATFRHDPDAGWIIWERRQ